MVYNIFGSCTQTILGKTKTRGVYFEEKSGVFSLKYQVIGIVGAIVIFIEYFLHMKQEKPGKTYRA